MCNGGRIQNYLDAFLPEPTADVLFVGYQAKGTLGRDIQYYGPRGGYIFLNEKRVDIQAGVHTINGYSAHADQDGLIHFATAMQKPPSVIKLVHGDQYSKNVLQEKLAAALPKTLIDIPT
jgi:metallo-beta-lactamase family protein